MAGRLFASYATVLFEGVAGLFYTLSTLSQVHRHSVKKVRGKAWGSKYKSLKMFLSSLSLVNHIFSLTFTGVWDFMTGKLKYRLANAALGAIVTHALVNKDATFIVAAESG